MAKKKAKTKTEKKKSKPKQVSKETGQPEINIGLVGHVDHGKTTLTEKLTGKWTDTHSEELKRGITIKLGYADSVFRKCKKCDYYTIKEKCPKCKGKTEVVRNVSFIDAPGHESLMAIMLSAAQLLDGALLIIAANEQCPQPQTKEHLMALQIAGIKNVIIIQNKIDLVTNKEALNNYKQIKDFLKNTDYKDAPVIPISAQHDVNVNLVIKYLVEQIAVMDKNADKDPQMFVARSFDINKPGSGISDLKGGVLGGVLVQGKLKTGDEIEIRPGIITEEKNKMVAKPLKTEIVSIISGGKSLNSVKPGGSLGILTKLDPFIVGNDKLIGNIIGLPDKLPPVHYSLNLKTNLLEKVIGAKEDINVEPLKMNEILMLNVNTATTIAYITRLGKNEIECVLKKPICAEINSKVIISRRIGTRFRLIGYGIIEQDK
ncbi:translation initiation factor IF-2 subunit gamma [Candidatus Woesearchaeota archaeon]|nr:translation initiation factor IF-2 subunit gamma [Candidatus Woesearchaeota archaeon]